MSNWTMTMDIKLIACYSGLINHFCINVDLLELNWTRERQDTNNYIGNTKLSQFEINTLLKLRPLLLIKYSQSINHTNMLHNLYVYIESINGN
jgi:hypothetical protein